MYRFILLQHISFGSLWWESFPLVDQALNSSISQLKFYSGNSMFLNLYIPSVPDAMTFLLTEQTARQRDWLTFHRVLNFVHLIESLQWMSFGRHSHSTQIPSQSMPIQRPPAIIIFPVFPYHWSFTPVFFFFFFKGSDNLGKLSGMPMNQCRSVL